MTPILAGALRLSPLADSGGGVTLRLAPEAPDDADDAARARVLPQGEAIEARLLLAAGPFAASLAGRPVSVVIAAEDEFLLQQTVVPAATAEGIAAGPVVLPSSAFDDRAGAVRLAVTVDNGFDVAVTLVSERFTLKLSDTEDSRRLERMLSRVLAWAPRLLPGDGEDDAASTSAGRPTSTTAFWTMVERITAAYTELHRYFEKSARFRLQQGERMTTLARVTSVTHRTLEFIATHPEELLPTDRASGIAYGGRRWLPGRTVDETHQKTYDIYENRCVTGFLQTVLAAAQGVVKSLEKLSAQDDSALFQSALAPVWREKTGLLGQLQGLAAAYARFFALEETAPLAALPQPSPIFISSAPYRRLYELMQAWFAAELPNFADVRCLLAVSKSSRIYEHYVLTLLIESLGEPQRRRRLAWPGAPLRLQQSAVCNEYVFVRDGREVTLFYEPVVPSGLAGESPTGLVRTMTFDFTLRGAAKSDPAAAFWTPDYVLRVKDEHGARCWIADAKYQTWPSFLAHGAEETLVKYLVATSPRDPAESMAGLMVFCGKAHGAPEERRSLRNVDAPGRLGPAAEVMTLCGDAAGETERLTAWVKAL